MRQLPYRLGRFTLFDHLATGGMADIYLARATTELGAARLLVIKEMLPKRLSDPRWTEMLVDEAKLSAQLTHANIARVEELGRHEGSLYIAMEYVEGLDLRELLKQSSVRKLALPMEYRLYVVREMLRALDYAHRYRLEDAVGIVHRDVSPSNVLLSFDGEVKLCDFGIASAIQLDLVPSETVEGKAGYMSPEQARGESIDERADLFAAGIILWELLAGKRLYKASEGLTLIELARRGEIPALKKLNLPEEERLRAIVGRALAVDPEARYATAAAMFDDLYGYCLATKQMASALRFGEWLSSHFAAEKVARRRARERALVALELGPPLVMEPIPSSRGLLTLPEDRRSKSGPLDPPRSSRSGTLPVSEPDDPLASSDLPASTSAGHSTGRVVLVAALTALALVALLALTGTLRW
ncbi:MAG: serine/threonine protein kinase [Deltaproteobacteria bacterium]|nr:serine/threonine protein kinase [Deltaproteobacteria bacterium]